MAELELHRLAGVVLLQSRGLDRIGHHHVPVTVEAAVLHVRDQVGGLRAVAFGRNGRHGIIGVGVRGHLRDVSPELGRVVVGVFEEPGAVARQRADVVFARAVRKVCVSSRIGERAARELLRAARADQGVDARLDAVVLVVDMTGFGFAAESAHPSAGRAVAAAKVTHALGHVVGVGTPLHHRDGRTFANRDELGVLARGLLHEYAIFIVAANEVVPDEAAGEGDLAVAGVVFAVVVGLDDGVHAHLVGQGACNRHAGADAFGGRELRVFKGRQGGVDLIGGGFDRDDTVLGGLTGHGRSKLDRVDPAVPAHRPRRRFVEGDGYRRLLGNVHAAGPDRAVLEADDVFTERVFFVDGFAKRSPVQVDFVLEVSRPPGRCQGYFSIVDQSNVIVVVLAIILQPLNLRVELIDDVTGEGALVVESEFGPVLKVLLDLVWIVGASLIRFDGVGSIPEEDASRQRQIRFIKTEA